MWKGKNDHCDVLLLEWPHYSFVPLHNLSADAAHLFSSSSPALVKYSTMAMQSTILLDGSCRELAQRQTQCLV